MEVRDPVECEKEGRKFIVYTASAGSGKTFTLVKEYLQLALQGGIDQYRHILAITFTNKAAAEMKQRVLQSLSDFSNGRLSGGSGVMFEEIRKNLGIDEETLKKKSADVFCQILHHYSDFSISTIDKFSHRIIRTFAHDLRIDGSFNVELDENDLLHRTVDEIIDLAGTDDLLTRLLLDFTMKRLEEDKNWQIDQDLYEFSKLLQRETSPEKFREIIQVETEKYIAAQKMIMAKVYKFQSSVVNSAEELKKLIDEAGVDPNSLAEGATKGLYKYLEFVIDKNWPRFFPNDKNRKNIEEGNWLSGKGKKDPDQKARIEGIEDQLSSGFNGLLELVDSGFSNAYKYKLWGDMIFQVALLARLREKWESLKKELNILPISDFNKKIAEVVATEPIPFIYERIGEYYEHYLIDEFQDTSVMQWQNFLPLIENSLAKGKKNLIVGDPKQSIYRFRGGEFEQFTSLPEVFEPINPEFAQYWQQALENNICKVSLPINYRSKAEIVQFNNRLFKFLNDNQFYNDRNVFNSVEQQVSNPESGGGVRLDLLEGDDEDEDNLNLIVEHIQACIDDGFEYSDIAVLTNRKADGSKVAEKLSEHDINFISADSLLISSSTRVKMLIHLLHVLSGDTTSIHKIKLAEHISVREGNFSSQIDKMIQIRRGELDIFDFLEEYNIHFDLNEMYSLPVCEICEYAIRAFGWNKSTDVFLESFVDHVLGFTINNGNHLNDFLSDWQIKSEKKSIKVPGKANAVNILTVHKSKGLEFPVVIHPFANTSTKKIQHDLKWVEVKDELPELRYTLVKLNSSMELMDEEYSGYYRDEYERSYLDNFNATYVACTRAVDRLYIITKKKAKSDYEKVSMDKFFNNFLISEGVDTSSGRVEFGSFEPKQTDSESGSENNEEISDVVSNDWRERIRISFRAEMLWNDEVQDAISYGNLIHDMLSRVNVKDDVDGELKRLRLTGVLKKEETDHLEKMLDRLMNDEFLGRFYTDEFDARNEASILLPDGSLFRPDRMLFKEREVVILDYKTGIRKSNHNDQLKNYARLMNEMDFTVKEAFLVYLNEEFEVQKVI